MAACRPAPIDFVNGGKLKPLSTEDFTGSFPASPPWREGRAVFVLFARLVRRLDLVGSRATTGPASLLVERRGVFKGLNQPEAAKLSLVCWKCRTPNSSDLGPPSTWPFEESMKIVRGSSHRPKQVLFETVTVLGLPHIAHSAKWRARPWCARLHHADRRTKPPGPGLFRRSRRAAQVPKTYPTRSCSQFLASR